MKNLILVNLLLLSGCMLEEETIIVSHDHQHVTDTMDEEPIVNVHGHLYVDDIIR